MTMVMIMSLKLSTTNKNNSYLKKNFLNVNNPVLTCDLIDI